MTGVVLKITPQEHRLSRSKRPREQSLLVHSPAKINLFLEVIGRRPDGFHQLETVMVRTDLFDTLRFERREDNTIELTLVGNQNAREQDTQTASANSRSFPLDETNLIVRAAMALQTQTGGSHGATIRVHKRIPSQAGLGGGSGNAATTLLTLNRLWELNLPISELHEIASSLGSDVNFLLSGYRAALCSGRGEQLRPITVNGRYNGILIVPRSGNSTAEVFRALELTKDLHSGRGLIEALRCSGGQVVQSRCFNRLQTVAEQLNPDVQATLSWLDKRTGGGLMTGSGSGCFTLLNSAADARRLAKQFGSHGSGLARSFQF